MKVTSKAFTDGGIIPVEYTKFGKDISPDFSIQDLPPETKTLAIIMDDLDVPFTKEYNHWVIFNIPVTNDIPSGIPHGGKIEEPFHAIQGIGYGKNKYRGPNPPFFMRKPHRYVFTFFALSKEIELTENTDKACLLDKIKDCTIASTKITGLYGNSKKI